MDNMLGGGKLRELLADNFSRFYQAATYLNRELPIMDFNDVVADNSTIDVELLKKRINERAIEVLRYLLPSGVVNGLEYESGDLSGSRGKSFKISLKEGKIGVGEDFSTGETVGDLIEVWQKVRGVDFKTTIKEIGDFIGDSAPTTKKTLDRSKPSMSWTYRDADGKPLFHVHRFETPTGKEVIPQALDGRWIAPPEPRPLYGLDRIAANKKDSVIVCEGEKAVDAATQAGLLSVCWQGGCNAFNKSDWTPLKGRDVIIWPDADAPGIKAAKGIAGELAKLGVTARILEIKDKPKAWDCFDAVADGLDIKAFISQAEKIEGFSIARWSATNFTPNKAPAHTWLVENVIPIGTAGMLAALGGVGKGMLTLDLALKVTSYREPKGTIDDNAFAFGGRVITKGAAVILSAEDDKDELHRRLDGIDKYGERTDRLFIVPLPNTGGPLPLVENTSSGLRASDKWVMIVSQLKQIKDLRLVVFDPLASFVHADINADPAAGAFVTGMFAALATELKCVVMLCHHMKKSKDEISTSAEAREAIRGTTALVDGLRWVYTVWNAPMDKAKRVCDMLNIPLSRKAVCNGAVVKANFKHDDVLRTFTRAENGLLVDRTNYIKTRKHNRDEIEDMLLEAITSAAIAGRPYMVTGKSGLYNRREELPEELRIGRVKLEVTAQSMLDKKKIVKAIASGSHAPQWLDVPGGPFALGAGEFIQGA